MRRKLSLFALIFFFGYVQVWGCDVCGCAASGGMMGIMSNYKSNFVSFGWRYSRFSASENLDGGRDYFQQPDLRVGLRLNRRIQIQAILPYNLNTHVADEEKSFYKGLGDGWAMAEFTAFQSKDSTASAFRHFLSLGTGIKIPTGKFDLENQENPMPANFQMGSGSWDYLLHVFYNIRLKSLGLSMDISGRLNTANTQDYRFGDQLAGTVYLSWLFQSSKASIMPFAGIYHEQLGKNVHNNVYQYGTGGSGTFGTMGIEAQMKRWGIRVTYTPHLSSTYAEGEISGGNRLGASLSFLF